MPLHIEILYDDMEYVIELLNDLADIVKSGRLTSSKLLSLRKIYNFDLNFDYICNYNTYLMESVKQVIDDAETPEDKIIQLEAIVLKQMELQREGVPISEAWKKNAFNTYGGFYDGTHGFMNVFPNLKFIHEHLKKVKKHFRRQREVFQEIYEITQDNKLFLNIANQLEQEYMANNRFYKHVTYELCDTYYCSHNFC